MNPPSPGLKNATVQVAYSRLKSVNVQNCQVFLEIFKCKFYFNSTYPHNFKKILSDYMTKNEMRLLLYIGFEDVGRYSGTMQVPK